LSVQQPSASWCARILHQTLSKEPPVVNVK